MKHFFKYKRKAILISLCAFFIPLCAQESPISVEWKMGKNGAAENMYSSSFIITNTSNKTLNSDWDFYFNNYANKIILLGKEPKAAFVDFAPNYYKISPTKHYKPLLPGDTIRIDFLTAKTFLNISYKPDGGHVVMKNGEILPVKLKIAQLTDPQQWERVTGKFATYPDGKYVYNKNNIINNKTRQSTGSIYNIIPAPKSITPNKGITNISNEIKINYQPSLAIAKEYLKEKLSNNGITESPQAKVQIDLSLGKHKNSNTEYYEIIIGGNKVSITANTQEGILNGIKTLLSVIEKETLPIKLPNVKITDYPDLNYRGMMLDIARNFTRFADLKRYIDMLATYKVNKFHFHFSDDEAWRLEIPGLPELTTVGSRKGFTLDDKEFLKQTYCGTGNPNDTTNSANGYITRNQFIELLKYAQQRGVDIIPELECPGHARAAIKSMRNRYSKYINTDPAKANEYKMWDDNDASDYTAPQGYTDNILNYAQEGTYNFIEKIVDEILKMYDEAGVKITTFHLGGDEVPPGSWEKSPLVHDLLKKKNLKNVHEGTEYFLDRVSKMLADRNVPAGGWQEVALNHTPEYNAKVAPRFNVINSWATMGREDTIPYQIANSGYKVVLSNVTNFYFDMVYSRHQDEQGLNWGGAVDEFTAWNALPYKIYSSARINNQDNNLDYINGGAGKTKLLKKQNIVGVQAQLWAETIRNFDMVCSYTIPRIFGLAERGWNASPTWSNDLSNKSLYEKEMAQFNLKIGKFELPRIKKANLNFHIGQPGIIIKNGMLQANSQYPDVEIRYTIDGSEPTQNSTLWVAPIPCKAKTVKARAYYLGKQSVTTTFNNM